MKWTNDPTNPAGKIQCGRANQLLRDLEREHYTKTQKSGIFGKTEGFDRETAVSVASYMIGSDNNPKRDDVTKAQEEIGIRFNWTVSKANANEICQAIAAVLPALEAARPVEDTRQTQEAADAEHAKNLADNERSEAERKARTDAEHAKFIAHYGNPASAAGTTETITVPDGMMPVTISLKFDNSDSMTDYFDRHASLGPDFLLGYVPKQAQTEALARRLLARYPEFAAIGEHEVEGRKVSGFTWNTEKYSMGHGNYLDGTGFELPPDLQGLRKAYRGGDVTHARWQVEFSYTGRYGTDKYLPIKGYPGVNVPFHIDVAPPPHSAAGTAGTVTFNTALNGVEVAFPAKPDGSVIVDLKCHGFRWSMRNKCWYKRQSQDAIAFAYRIAGVTPPVAQTSGLCSVPVAAGPDRFDMQVEDNMAAAVGA
jgi:hypothetical protein